MRLTSLISVFALILAGCSSNVDSHKYYKFTIDSNDSKPSTSVIKPRVYIDTISILGAANQQALIQYIDKSRVNIANFHYWAEHPEHMLAQATNTYLTNEGFNSIPLAFAGDDVEQYVTLKIVINEFAGHFSEGAILRGNWYLYQRNKRNKVLLNSSSFSLSNPLDNDGFDALVMAHRNNWQSLMTAITNNLRQIEKQID
ncbi:PqiC family protein [Pseudoalteromonas luteoviolacea]|uniref:PqiC family protein n=1 Tax=Pseudoalteromonas luteoviolacea TaxID=43657 RepID=UPI0007B05DA8|nr:ABC-type transport auxiliary lipoprotein family protein [Pseudoalteromonas luteoviolacea]KZN56951.1 hypothetical protein N474_10035 [Pseudoalteromonas luteoviolacea CPMOR-2]TQF67474.1 hypothetical protein FLM44_20015 [Pseudoalteromonas luteoviolacea]